MGKVRIKTLGLPEEEEKEKGKAKARREGKKARLDSTEPAKKTAKPLGLKGDERVVAMGPTKEEAEAEQAAVETEEKTKVKRARKKRGRRYQEAARLVEKNRAYPLLEALSLVKKTSFSHFDGSVEVHINVAEKGLSGNVNFPHGTGRELRVAIVNDKVLLAIEQGKIDFDVLIATPELMPKLARFAKILGPRGLMPNPKAGTVTKEPEKVAEKLKGGQRRFKTEVQAPIIHSVIGRVSFPKDYLEENLKAIISALGVSKIKSLTLSSSMGPGVKVDLTTV